MKSWLVELMKIITGFIKEKSKLWLVLDRKKNVIKRFIIEVMGTVCVLKLGVLLFELSRVDNPSENMKRDPSFLVNF